MLEGPGFPAGLLSFRHGALAVLSADPSGLRKVAAAVLTAANGKEMKILTQEEIQRFLIQAKAEGMYELFLLELTTGMRRGELLALRWDDLDFATGKLRIDKQVYPVGGKLMISEPKTKAANRTIILPPAMVDLLAEYKKGVFSELMFPSRTKPEQPIDPGYVRKRLQVILERAGCKKVRFHDLRHPYVKHTTKKYNSEKQKTQATKIDLIAWVFCFCIISYSKEVMDLVNNLNAVVGKDTHLFNQQIGQLGG